MRKAGTICIAMALALVLVALFVSYWDWEASSRLFIVSGSAILFCLLLAAVLMVNRAAARRENLIGAVRASEQRTAAMRDLLYTTLTSIGDGVIATDTNEIITFLNPEAQRLTGWSADQAIGQPLEAVFHIRREFTREPVDNPARRVLRKGAVLGPEYLHTLTSRTGQSLPIDESAAPIRDHKGEITGVALVFRDVTVRRKAVLAYLHLASIVESSEDGIISERLDGTFTSWNEAAARIFGFSAEEMIGSTAAALVPPERAGDLAGMIGRIQRGEPVRRLETLRRRKDGQEITIDLTISPIRDAVGAITGVSKIVRDITDRKRAEAAMRAMQEQLLHSQKIESLSVLAGGVAHDFNNLLTGIIANATLMMDEAPPGSLLADLIDQVLDASEQAAHLTLQMLAYSGKGRFAVRPLNLNHQIEAIAPVLQLSVRGDVNLRLDLARDLPFVEADAAQIQQLVTNLILNAEEAIDGKGVVTVSAAREELTETDPNPLVGIPLAPGPYISIQVADNGCGIDQATQARMFDPFFTTKFTGRGLGLAAVLGIVRGHKGGIRVSSSPGTGAAFRVLLPVRDSRARAAQHSR